MRRRRRRLKKRLLKKAWKKSVVALPTAARPGRGAATIKLIDEFGQPVVTGKPIPKGTVIGFAGAANYWWEDDL